MQRRDVSTRAKRLTFFGVAAGVAAMTLLALATPILPWFRTVLLWDGPATLLGPAQAFEAARRTETVLRDTTAFWTERFEKDFDRPYEPPEIVYFTGVTPSPCAGADLAAMPFYCDETRTAVMDLTFFDKLSRALNRDGDLAVALYAARIASTHVQGELDALSAWRSAAARASRSERRDLDAALAEQGDCLTGVWAASSLSDFDQLSPDLFGRLVEAAADVAREQRPAEAKVPDVALFSPAPRAAREGAFAAGLRGQAIGACVPPS